MQHKKLASLLSIAVLWLAAPFFAVPSAHAFHSTVDVEHTGWLVQSTFDNFLGTTVDAVREGSTLNFQVKITASSTVFQRNLTVGVRPDWATTFTNATNARPTSTLSLQANEFTIVTVPLTIPTLTGASANLNMAPHRWDVRVWNTAKDSSATGQLGDCNLHQNTAPYFGCDSESRSNLAIYSNDQADGVRARIEANSKTTSLENVLSSLLELPPGAGRAASDVSTAKAELSLGDTSYAAGDFAAAKTHYTSALNLANSAAGALSGGDSADFTNLLLNGTGWLLGGVGVFIAGFGSFWYLRKKPKA